MIANEMSFHDVTCLDIYDYVLAEVKGQSIMHNNHARVQCLAQGARRCRVRHRLYLNRLSSHWFDSVIPTLPHRTLTCPCCKGSLLSCRQAVTTEVSHVRFVTKCPSDVQRACHCCSSHFTTKLLKPPIPPENTIYIEYCIIPFDQTIPLVLAMFLKNLLICPTHFPFCSSSK